MQMDKEIRFRKLPPVWFINALNAFRRFLLKLNHRLFPGNVVLYEHFQYFWLLPCIRVAAELDIAGILMERPQPVSELATLTGTDPENLSRIMRALSSHGIFRRRKDSTYCNSRMSKALAEGEGSLRYMMMQHLGSFNWKAFSELGHAVRTGENSVKKFYGIEIYDFLRDHPEEARLFEKSMTDLSMISVEPILNVCDFSKFNTITDIGGGEGLMLSAILHENKDIKGILFDRPEAMERSEDIFRLYGVGERIRKQEGDFFLTAPEGADLYFLKNVLHNWGDEDCIAILGNIRKQIPSQGKVMILEMIIEDNDKPSFAKLIDIQMMVFMNKGKERTHTEYEKLLSRSGFRVSRIVPTISPLSIIEGVPAV
jgi:hypothetical protein